MSTIRVTVWNEYRHEKKSEKIAAIYPDGIHGAIAAFLRDAGMTVGTATLDEPEHGLTDAVLEQTDVLIWWGHMAHREVDDAIVARVHQKVLDGMGHYMSYGLCENTDVVFRHNLLPIGLAEGCTLKHDIVKDQVLTINDVTFPEGRLCDRLRSEQNNHFFNS